MNIFFEAAARIQSEAPKRVFTKNASLLSRWAEKMREPPKEFNKILLFKTYTEAPDIPPHLLEGLLCQLTAANVKAGGDKDNRRVSTKAKPGPELPKKVSESKLLRHKDAPGGDGFRDTSSGLRPLFQTQESLGAGNKKTAPSKDNPVRVRRETSVVSATDNLLSSGKASKNDVRAQVLTDTPKSSLEKILKRYEKSVEGKIYKSTGVDASLKQRTKFNPSNSRVKGVIPSTLLRSSEGFSYPPKKEKLTHEAQKTLTAFDVKTIKKLKQLSENTPLGRPVAAFVIGRSAPKAITRLSGPGPDILNSAIQDKPLLSERITNDTNSTFTKSSQIAEQENTPFALLKRLEKIPPQGELQTGLLSSFRQIARKLDSLERNLARQAVNTETKGAEPSVEWFDDDDLAGRIHNILKRQARRKGILFP